MLRYLINDIQNAMKYLPHMLVAVLVTVVIVALGNVLRKLAGKERKPVLPSAFAYGYMVLILVITLLSREDGSHLGLDLTIGSTWGINARNNAYVLENVLLFVPFGFFAAWKWRWMQNVFNSCFVGILFSLLIECLQLLTARGYFQIDDLITNAIGCIIGCFLFFCKKMWKI